MTTVTTIVAGTFLVGAWLTYGVGAGYLLHFPEPWNVIAMIAVAAGCWVAARRAVRSVRRSS